MKKNNEIKKNEIEDKLYNDDLSLEELLMLKEEMKKLDFSKFDLQRADDLILEEIERIEDISIIKNLKNKYSTYDTSLFDRVIDKRELLKKKEIEEMSRDEVEYIFDNEMGNLDVIGRFRLLKAMKKHGFSNEDINDIMVLINDKIDDIEYNDYYELLNILKNIKFRCIKYGCDVSILNNYIDCVKKKTEPSISFGEMLLGIIFGDFGKPNTHNSDDLMPWEKDAIKSGGYEKYNFEEEDLEEDDYYYEDE